MMNGHHPTTGGIIDNPPWNVPGTLPMDPNSTFNFNMNSTLNITGTSHMEENLYRRATKVIGAGFTTAGSAFCLANSLLVLYFTRKKQFTKTTFIFLCNLGISDIIMGLSVFLLGIMLFVPSLNAVGSEIFRVGATCAGTMSAECILLLSIQVSKLPPM